MFFIFGFTKKPVGKENRTIRRNGQEMTAQITVFKKYIELFFIPLIPTGKSYAIYIPQTDEYYEQGNFNRMPEDLLEACQEVGRKY